MLGFCLKGYAMNKNGMPVTRRDLNSFDKKSTSTSDIDDNINENVLLRHRSYDSSNLWFSFVRSTPNSSKSRGHKKNVSSTTTFASSNMMPALPNDSQSDASMSR